MNTINVCVSEESRFSLSKKLKPEKSGAAIVMDIWICVKKSVRSQSKCWNIFGIDVHAFTYL